MRRGGQTETGGSATETTVQQLDARKCSMSLHAQGIAAKYSQVTARKLYNSDDSDGPSQLKSIQNSNIPPWKRS